MLAVQRNTGMPRDPEELALGKKLAIYGSGARCLGGAVSVEQDIGQDQERLLPRDVRESRFRGDGGQQAKSRPRWALEEGVVSPGELFDRTYRMARPDSHRGR